MLSPAGAIGIGQVMPATGKAEAKRCGFGEIVVDDLKNNELNLRISACHFAQLLEKTSSFGEAVMAYNGGANSKTLIKARQFVPGTPETMGYLAMYYFILEKGGVK